MMPFFGVRRRATRAVDDVKPVHAAAERIAGHLVSLVAPAAFAAERYRVLRHTVEQIRKDSNFGLFGITSAAVGDGKTTTAINLAGALAQASDARVLLIDADLRRGRIREDLGLTGGDQPGLAEVILDEQLALNDAVRQCGDFNLFVLPAGRCPAAPYEALKSARIGQLLDHARAEYEFVVVDTAPLLAVPDTRMLAKWIDGFFMVIAAHKTRRHLVEEAFDLIDPAKMLGAIFNGDDSPVSSYSSYGYTLYGLGQNDNGHRRQRPWHWIGKLAGRPQPRAS